MKKENIQDRSRDLKGTPTHKNYQWMGGFTSTRVINKEANKRNTCYLSSARIITFLINRSLINCRTKLLEHYTDSL